MMLTVLKLIVMHEHATSKKNFINRKYFLTLNASLLKFLVCSTHQRMKLTVLKQSNALAETSQDQKVAMLQGHR